MDDLKFGTEDSRGNWRPKKLIKYAPVFKWPPKPKSLFKWIFGFPGFLLPWNTLYALAAIFIWTYLTPPLEFMVNLKIDWIGLILLRNLVLLILVVGSLHLWLYVLRKQSNNFKYNRSWPKKISKIFLFNNQTYDNIFWTILSGVTIWTAYEVLLLWAYANGIISMINYNENPFAFIALFLLIPFVHEVGFYFCHRILHWPPLYKIAHNVHHRNTNPGPWSGLSMHPIEHLMYFAIILLIFIFPTHPIHMINLASRLGISPVHAHTGFDHVIVGKKSVMDNSNFYAHYLHHKYFEVNYADGIFPLDRWFGSFHDGSEEGDEKMKIRLKNRNS